MTITLSQAEYEQLWQENTHRNFQDGRSSECDRNEVIQDCPQLLGAGYLQEVHLREISLTIFDYQLYDDLIVKDDSQSDEPQLEFGFHLSGTRCGKQAGQNFAEWGIRKDGEVRIYDASARERILKLDMHLETLETFQEFIVNDLDRFPLELKQLVEGGEQKHYRQVDRITPAMRLSLEQILNCPYQGAVRQLYLESRCLELIAFKLDQLIENETKPKPVNALKNDDIERIHQAKQILIHQFDNPPSLLELARRVGLNDFKLKLGFRQVFGTTTFEYLQRYRMEQARLLMLEQQMNVKEVSRAVGYKNQSHFAAAFRKQFGVNPKALMMGKNPSAV
jgi:AraC family transcriptional regulator, transcriptional activator of the genes for pyochelin and ferripyochelin receptors